MRQHDGLDVLLWFMVAAVAMMQLLIIVRMAAESDESIQQCVAQCVR